MNLHLEEEQNYLINCGCGGFCQHMPTTLYNHIIVGHNDSLEITLILITLRINVGHVNVQPMPNL